jgi:exoribonuclease R
LGTSSDKHGDQIGKDIQALYQLSTALRENRQRCGLFTQMRDELEYEFEDGNEEQPITVSISHKKPAAFMVKEFLFLANKHVAQRISSQFPNHALLRRHSPPSERKIVRTLHSHHLTKG